MSATIFRAEEMEESDRLASAYFTNENERERVDKLLARYGVSAEAVTAKSIADNLATLEEIEQQIQLAIARAYAMHAKLGEMSLRNGHRPARKLRTRRQIAA
jgi:hypothetical protein